MEITIILSACRWKSLSFYQPADGNHYHSISQQMEITIILSACRWKPLSFYQPADGKHYHSISLQMENTIIPSACRWKTLSFHQLADGNHYHCISLQIEITVTASACRWKSLSLHQPADRNHYHRISLQMEITIIQSACRWKSLFTFSTFSGQPASLLGALFTNPLKTHKELSIKTKISMAVRLIFHRKKRTAEEGKNPLPSAPSFQSFSFEAIPMPATSCFHIDILCAVPSTNMQKSKSWHDQVTLRTRQVTGIKGSVTNEN